MVMRTGCSNSSFRPQFLIELQPAHLSKLKLPSEFMMHMEEEDKSRSFASVLSPINRKPWMIRLSKDHSQSQTFFKQGWHDFSEFHKLEAGFKLVFRYEGNMVFTVKVFGFNGCLKNYNRDAPADFRRIGYKDSREKTQEESASLLEMEAPSSSHKHTKRKRAPVSEKKTAHHERSNKRVEIQAASKSHNKKKNRNFISTSHHTHETRISDWHIRCFMALPKNFGKIPPCNLEKGKITMKNEKQKTWQIQFNTTLRYNCLCAGWKDFCSDNNIEIGDKCVLKITSRNEILFSITKADKIDEEIDAESKASSELHSKMVKSELQ